MAEAVDFVVGVVFHFVFAVGTVAGCVGVGGAVIDCAVIGGAVICGAVVGVVAFLRILRAVVEVIVRAAFHFVHIRAW